jgi:hypothetical protein
VKGHEHNRLEGHDRNQDQECDLPCETIGPQSLQ